MNMLTVKEVEALNIKGYNIDRIQQTEEWVIRIGVSSTFEGLFDDFVLYDNSGPKGTPPLKVASAVGTKLVIHDKAAWDRFVAKGTYVYDRLAEQRDTAADASH